MKHHLARLDRVACKMNVLLLAVAVGLAMLDFMFLVTRFIPPLVATHTAIAVECPGAGSATYPSSQD